MVTVKPKEWKNGSTPDDAVAVGRSRRAARSPRCWRSGCSARARTPLGTPVEPLEKITAAGESGVRPARESSAAGAKRAARQRARLAQRGAPPGEGPPRRPCPARASPTCRPSARKRARGDDGADAALFHGRRHGLAPGREVEVDRHCAAQRESEIDQRAGHRRGQQHADHGRRPAARLRSQRQRRSALRHRSASGPWNRPWRSGFQLRRAMRIRRRSSRSPGVWRCGGGFGGRVPGWPAAPACALCRSRQGRAEAHRHAGTEFASAISRRTCRPRS